MFMPGERHPSYVEFPHQPMTLVACLWFTFINFQMLGSFEPKLLARAQDLWFEPASQ